VGAGLVGDAGEDRGGLGPGLRLVERLEPLVELGELLVDLLLALLGETARRAAPTWTSISASMA
jgi:hypothetical protein